MNNLMKSKHHKWIINSGEVARKDKSHNLSRIDISRPVPHPHPRVVHRIYYCEKRLCSYCFGAQRYCHTRCVVVVVPERINNTCDGQYHMLVHWKHSFCTIKMIHSEPAISSFRSILSLNSSKICQFLTRFALFASFLSMCWNSPVRLQPRARLWHNQ